MATYRSPRSRRWRRVDNHTFRRGRRPLRLVVALQLHSQWRGLIEYWPLPCPKTPHYLPLTGLYASHENAIDATEEAVETRLGDALARAVASLRDDRVWTLHQELRQQRKERS